MINTALRTSLTAVAFAAAVSTSAVAGPLPLFPFEPLPAPHAPRAAAYAPVQSPVETQEQTQEPAAIASQSRFKRQVVNYATHEAPGTVIVDTANTYLYFVLGGGKAIRYGIGVGRNGFTWSGIKTVERKAEWPDWRPPQEMLERQPYLPRFMAGGPDNPLGARAMYLSGSVYRIHGTNAPSTIGQRVSSGCFRLKNEDVKDLYDRVKVGAKVVVLPLNDRRISNRSGFSTN
jgi:lipoprotein-anchoring transpeptidase ErfK/SrfK